MYFITNGHCIKDDDTPSSMELEDDFVIGVYDPLDFGCLLLVCDK